MLVPLTREQFECIRDSLVIEYNDYMEDADPDCDDPYPLWAEYEYGDWGCTVLATFDCSRSGRHKNIEITDIWTWDMDGNYTGDLSMDDCDLIENAAYFEVENLKKPQWLCDLLEQLPTMNCSTADSTTQDTSKGNSANAA